MLLVCFRMPSEAGSSRVLATAIAMLQQRGGVRGHHGCHIWSILRQRKNARDVARHLCCRLLGELKGLSLPVRVLTDEVSATAKTALFHASRMRDDLPREDLINLGGELYVTTIERTLLDCAYRLSPVQLMVRLFEACGTYAVPPAVPRVRCAVNMLLASG